MLSIVCQWPGQLCLARDKEEGKRPQGLLSLNVGQELAAKDSRQTWDRVPGEGVFETSDLIQSVCPPPTCLWESVSGGETKGAAAAMSPRPSE